MEYLPTFDSYLTSISPENQWLDLKFPLKWSPFFVNFFGGIPNCCKWFPDMGKQEYLKCHCLEKTGENRHQIVLQETPDMTHKPPTQSKDMNQNERDQSKHLEFWVSNQQKHLGKVSNSLVFCEIIEQHHFFQTLAVFWESRKILAFTHRCRRHSKKSWVGGAESNL